MPHAKQTLNVILAVAAGICTWAASPDWRVVTTFAVGGSGGWDYLTSDSATGGYHLNWPHSGI